MMTDKKEGNDQSRDDPGQEQLTDGLLRDNAKDDQGDTRRDENPKRPHGGNDPCGEFLVVTIAIHLRDGHAGKGGSRCRRRSADGLEGGRSCHGGHGQSPWDMADELVGGIE